MDIEGVFGADILSHLANRFEEGETLDVTDGAADFNQDNVGVAEAGHLSDMAFDFIGDVGDHLNGAAKIVSPSLLGDHVVIDLPAGHVAELVEILVNEPFIVPQVQVGFGAVLGNEHFAVLIGRHRTGVHIEIGIELHGRHADAPGLEQEADRSDGHALSQA